MYLKGKLNLERFIAQRVCSSCVKGYKKLTILLPGTKKCLSCVFSAFLVQPLVILLPGFCYIAYKYCCCDSKCKRRSLYTKHLVLTKLNIKCIIRGTSKFDSVSQSYATQNQIHMYIGLSCHTLLQRKVETVRTNSRVVDSVTVLVVIRKTIH